MTILEKIVNDKREEVKINKSLTPLSKLEKSSSLNTNGKSLKNNGPLDFSIFFFLFSNQKSLQNLRGTLAD